MSTEIVYVHGGCVRVGELMSKKMIPVLVLLYWVGGLV